MGTRMPQALFLLLWVHSVSTCVYFNGPTGFANQTLVIMREREDYCVLDKWTTNGDTALCADNATATRVNDTQVLLYTNEGPNVTFFMNYGRDNEPGQNAQTYHADCPAPSAAPEKVNKTAERPRAFHRIWAASSPGMIIILIILIFIIYKKYLKKRKPEQICNVECLVSHKNGSMKNSEHVKVPEKV